MTQRVAGRRRKQRSNLFSPRVTEDPGRRLVLGIALISGVLLFGTVGYMVLGLPALEALYQSVETVSTVGFSDIPRTDSTARIFTIALILVGVAIMLYTFTLVLETLIEGRLTDQLWRRRMTKDIEDLQGHVVVAGCGRLGRAVAESVAGGEHDVVVIDNQRDRLERSDFLFIEGDATVESVMDEAGIARAGTLVAALSTDADNVYLTLSARAQRPDLFIIARARLEEAERRLLQAGADRVINPQSLGGARAGAMALQPHVAEFVDVVMHDRTLEFRLEELVVPDGSALSGTTIREAHIRDQTGALVLALREADGTFITNPAPETAMHPGHVLIVIGTPTQLDALNQLITS